MNEPIKYGDRVMCVTFPGQPRGFVIKQYYPTACPQQTQIICDVSGDQCMYYIPNSKKCAEEYGEGPDAGKEEEQSINELYRQVAFLARLLRKVIDDGPNCIDSNESQALDNIIDDLPAVTDDDFRW